MMRVLPQMLVAAAVAAVLMIVFMALFQEPDYASMNAGNTIAAAPAAPVAYNPAQPPSVIPAALPDLTQLAFPAFVPVAAQQPVAKARALPRSAYFAQNVQLAEAHWQGMEVIPLSTEIKTKLKLPLSLEGVLIDETTLVAAASGFEAGDVLQTVNGNPVRSINDVVRESKRVKRRKTVWMTVLRKGVKMRLALSTNEALGFAQAETAPMILPGDIMPHPYRGPCTQCHPIGTTGHMVPDPEMITLPPPVIRSGAVSPHQDRGPCEACHQLI